MDEFTIMFWVLAAFFLASGFYVAFKVGCHITRFLLVLFCRESKMADLCWKLFTVVELKFGKLKPGGSYIINGTEYVVQVTRRQPKSDV